MDKISDQSSNSREKNSNQIRSVWLALGREQGARVGLLPLVLEVQHVGAAELPCGRRRGRAPRRTQWVRLVHHHAARARGHVARAGRRRRLVLVVAGDDGVRRVVVRAAMSIEH